MYQRKPDGTWIAGHTFRHRRPMDMVIDGKGIIYVYAQDAIYKSIKPFNVSKFIKGGNTPLSRVYNIVHWQGKHNLGIDGKGNILAVRHNPLSASYYNLAKKKWTYFKFPDYHSVPKGVPKGGRNHWSYPYVIVDRQRGFIFMGDSMVYGPNWKGCRGCIGYFYNEDIPGGSKWKVTIFVDFKGWAFESDFYLDQ